VSSFQSDPALIEACLSGNRQAWSQLVERYSRLVWSIPRKYGLPHEDSEDVHQTVFASLIHHLSELRDRERLSSWLITTATRECWRLRRLAAARSARLGTIDVEGTVPVPLPETDFGEEQRQLVREGIERLNDRCRHLIQALFASDDEPHYPDVADRLHIPIGSIGPTRARCLAKLEAILRTLGVGEGRGGRENDERSR
jgi:RNA polymerase sigma factor (sigma-70 family)